MNRIDPNAPKHALPPCLRIPIAAATVGAVEDYVGKVDRAFKNRRGDIVAVLVRPHLCGMPDNPTAPLWKLPECDVYVRRLYPEFQVWVHVDYPRYRRAYMKFGALPLSGDQVLDHVQNRKAVRLRWCSHPYLRLCPVSRSVNSSGGHRDGAEGMEKAHLEKTCADATKVDDFRQFVLSHQIIYADPVDLTKMLDMTPGTIDLEGVGENLKFFYPSNI